MKKIRKQLKNLDSIKKLDQCIEKSKENNELTNEAIKKADEKYFNDVISDTDKFWTECDLYSGNCMGDELSAPC